MECVRSPMVSQQKVFIESFNDRLRAIILSFTHNDSIFSRVESLAILGWFNARLIHGKTREDLSINRDKSESSHVI
jgi:hypothetical protein